MEKLENQEYIINNKNENQSSMISDINILSQINTKEKITNNTLDVSLTLKKHSKIMKNLFKIFLNKNSKDLFFKFFDNENKNKMKIIFNKKFNIKENKKNIKERLKNYILDFGNNMEFVKFRISDNNNIILTTNIFNINPVILKSCVFVQYENELLELKMNDFYQYLKLLQKPYFKLCNKIINMKVCKSIIPFQIENQNEDFIENKSYNINDNFIDNKAFDFSKENLIQKQNNFLESYNQNQSKETVFFPLQFISSVIYWGIILCQGGYFSCAFFNKEKLIDHKSDHKYVVRKKAGQRQIVKDNMKSNKRSVGSQLRREGEKKHQENIEYILKLNDELLEKCDIIFIYAPGLNKNILVGNDEKTLFSFKKKVVNIPFSIPRANFSNLMEIYHKLINVVVEINEIKE